MTKTIRIDDDAAHLLVVDDDRRIRDLLNRYLMEKGFRVTTAADADEARRKLEGIKIKTVPVIMLTALAESNARIEGLEAGADDYLPKPFDPRELVLRINNILRRNAPAKAPKVEQVIFGPFTFSVVRKELRRGADHIRLTDREQEIMMLFSQRAGETIPRHELVSDEAEVGERTIDVQINRLRRKIEDDPSNPVWLQTVRGIGYRLSVD
jgi:two-component system phosphate regulon response regulator OmpR